MCLCATCHQRADHEGWGEEVLRRYKETPWILRKKLAESTIDNISEIRITIDISFDDFDERQERLLRHALASFLDISPNNIEIGRKEKGSVNVFVRLPRAASETLLQAFRDDPGGVRAALSLPVVDVAEAIEGSTSNESRIVAIQEISTTSDAEGKEIEFVRQLPIILQHVRERGQEEDYKDLVACCQLHVSQRAEEPPESFEEMHFQRIVVSAILKCLPVITSESSSIEKAQNWLEAALNDMVSSLATPILLVSGEWGAGKTTWIGGALKLISDEMPACIAQLSTKDRALITHIYSLDVYPFADLDQIHDVSSSAFFTAWEKLRHSVERRISRSFKMSRKLEADKAKRILHLARQRPLLRFVRSRPKKG